MQKVRVTLEFVLSDRYAHSTPEDIVDLFRELVEVEPVVGLAQPNTTCVHAIEIQNEGS